MNLPISADRAALLTEAERARLTHVMQVYVIREDSRHVLTRADACRILFVRYLLQSGRLDNPAIG